MAEVGRGEHEGQTIIVGGSVCAFDFYCEVCSDDGKHLEAAGYCVDCEEYLCGTCVSSHKRTRPSRFHKIQDDAEMQKDTPLTPARTIKTINTRYEAHPSEAVRFYCKVHCKFGCTTCFATTHKTCDGIDFIIEKSETILESDELKGFIQNLDSMKQNVRSMLDQIQVKNLETDQCCEDAVSSVREFRLEINTLLDTIEQNFLKQAQSIASDGKVKMTDLDQEIGVLSAKLSTISDEIDELQVSRRVCQLYITITNLNTDMEEFQERLRKAEENVVATNFTFEPNDALRNLLQTNDSFGSLSVARNRNNPSKITAKHVADIDVAPNQPLRTDFHIVNSIIMQKDRLIICDHTGYILKVVDIKSNTILTELSHVRLPFSLTFVDHNLLAVSHYDDKYISLFNVGDTISLERKIPIKEDGRGIAFSKGRLFVSYQTSPRIEVLDLQGRVIDTIQTDAQGKQIFSYPRQVFINTVDENIYVSDPVLNSVIRLTFNGVVEAVYTGMPTPQQICTDQHGYIFVCGQKEVHMLSKDLTLIKVLLTMDDGLSTDVLSISHCHNTDKLFVGMKDRYVKVYQLSWTKRVVAVNICGCLKN